MKLKPPIESLRLPDPAACVVEVAGLAAVWGLLAIYSAEWAVGSPETFLGRQTLWLLAAVAVGGAAWRIDFARWWRGRFWLPGLAALALAAVLTGGVARNGMTGWFDCCWFHLQPSELGKPLLLLGLTGLASLNCAWRWRFLLAMGVAGGFAGLIALQPDFGTMMLYGAAPVVVLYLAGAPWRWLLIPAAAAPAALGLAAWRYPYVRQRLTAFLHWRDDLAGTGWHWFQTQLTMARGGFGGSGLGEAWWSSHYLPLAINDSIFACIVETVGVAGAWAVLILWLVLLASLCRLGNRAATPERRLFIRSAGAWLGIQALVHMSVNVGLLPMTGLALPFFSYGGSSLVATFLLLGMTLSAARPGGRTEKNR